MAVSVLTLCEQKHQKVVDCVVVAGSPLNDYHTEQNKRLRSVPECRSWLQEQVSGKYMSHAMDFINILGDEASLMDVGLVVERVAEVVASPMVELEEQVPVQVPLWLEKTRHCCTSGQTTYLRPAVLLVVVVMQILVI